MRPIDKPTPTPIIAPICTANKGRKSNRSAEEGPCVRRSIWRRLLLSCRAHSSAIRLELEQLVVVLADQVLVGSEMSVREACRIELDLT